MIAKELLDRNQVREAEKVLSAHLRLHPGDTTGRTFLFELLCFAGEFTRAGKHLGMLAGSGPEAEAGALLYRSALHAERFRHELFGKREFPGTEIRQSPAGRLNGKPFQTITDLDPEIGARLEVYSAGAYLWLPFQHIASLRTEAPRRLRDTLWATAHIVTGPDFRGARMGEVLLPVVYPFSWNSDDQSAWLGRTTAWVADADGYEFPIGQKMFVVDGERVPMLEIRSLEFDIDAAA